MSAGGHSLAPAGYLPRVADREVERALRAAPAVVIEGPRACGKTWTGRRHARSEVPFDAVFDNRLAARVITAGGYGFEYPDGVAVVPITALGP